MTSTLLLTSFANSTQAAVNEWATRSGIPKTARILYDDSAYIDAQQFPNATRRAVPTWSAIDAKAPDYLVLSASIYETAHFQYLIQTQRLSRDDPADLVTGAYSVRVYQDLLPNSTFGPTGVPGIDYIGEIHAVPLQPSEPAWTAPVHSVLLDWAFSSLWWADRWVRYSIAVLPRLRSPGAQPLEGPTFRVYRINRAEGGPRRYAAACSDPEPDCVEFKQKLTQGEPLIVAFDACKENMGPVACGGKYEISYARQGDTWCGAVRRLEPGAEEDPAPAKSCQGNPEQNTLSIFSMPFTYTGKGAVYRLAGGASPALVGHLQRSP